MTALSTALQAELKTIDATISDANKRRDAILVLLDLPKPTFTAAQTEAPTAQLKAATAKVRPKVKRLRPTLRSDISVETIHDVRNLAREGYTHNQIAEIHDLGRSTVSNIIRKKSWFSTVE